jgi:hypothetical protein
MMSQQVRTPHCEVGDARSESLVPLDRVVELANGGRRRQTHPVPSSSLAARQMASSDYLDNTHLNRHPYGMSSATIAHNEARPSPAKVT